MSEVTQHTEPPRLNASPRAITSAEVFNIGQFRKAEGMEIADRHRRHSRYRTVTDLEPVPFPRCGHQPEQVPDDHRVRPGMSEQQNSPTWVLHQPHGQVVRMSRHTPFGEEHVGSEMNTVHKVTDGLATIEPRPAVLRRLGTHLGIGLLSLFLGGPGPAWVANLLQPRGNHLITAGSSQKRLRRLTGAQQGRYQDLIEMFIGEGRGHLLCLPLAEIGQRWVPHRETVAHPFRLAMTHEDDLHTATVGHHCTRGHINAMLTSAQIGRSAVPLPTNRPSVHLVTSTPTAERSRGVQILTRTTLTAVMLGFAAFWVWALFFASKEAINRIEDRDWSARAQQICLDADTARDALADYRRLDSGGAELIRERADIIDAATDIMDDMVDDIDAVAPTDDKGAAIVPMWIDEYRTYIGDRRRYANELRTTGENLPFYETMAEVPISERLATFAADNDMAACAPPFDLSM